MQSTDDKESIAAAIHLLKTGICLFDLSIGGARLRPIAFRSRGCDNNENTFIILHGKAHTVNGPSLKTGNTCGGVIFIGSMIAR